VADKQIRISDIRAKFPMYSDLSDDQLLISIRQKFYPDIPMREFAKHVEYKAPDPTEGMSGLDKFRAGMGKAAYDTARGIGQFIPGLVTREDVAESRKRDAALMNTGAGMAGDVAGNIAMLAGTALIPGAATIRGGALIGAATGAIQPSTSTSETIGNTVLGGAAGAAVPAAVRTYQAAKSAAEPFYESGKNAIVGRALNRAAGKDAPAVAQRLKEAATPFVGPSQGVPRTTMGELVPGSMPTVGQAADNAGVAALERAATASNPEMTNAVSDLMKTQNAARVGALQEMAGTDGRRLFMGEARDATANQLYGEARRLGIDPAALTPQVQANIATFAQRVPDEVLNYAKKLAKINGETMDNASSIQGMHWVKKALDGMIGTAERSGDAEMKRALTGLQKDLLTGMDNLSPAYENARKTYATMSRPINQMDVASDIIDKSVDKLTGNIQPRSLAKAVSDKTAARATGLPTATLEGTMAPAQMNALQFIMDDVRRATAAQNVGRGAGSDTVQKLAYTNMLDQAGVPTFLRNFAPAQLLGNIGSRSADLAYGRANRELGNRLAEVMLDPERASQLMLTAGPSGKNALALLMQRGGSGLAMSAPALANAHKE